MRYTHFFILALSASSIATPVLQTANREASRPPLARKDVVLQNRETGLTTIGETAVGAYDHELHKRWLALFITAVSVFNSIPRGWQLFMGLYSLGSSVYSIYNDCHAPEGKKGVFDCFKSCADLVLAAFIGAYKIKSGISRDSQGFHSLAVYEHPQFPSLAMHAHISPTNGSLAQSSIRSENNGTWQRHATVYAGDVATHHLLYRQALESDLSFENDGSYHHYRLQPTEEMMHILKSDLSKSLSEREENNVQGLVTDYIWKNNDQTVWQEFHDYSYNSGDTVAGWMEDHNSEASCAVPIRYSVVSEGYYGKLYGDQGVIAYGWNNKPYGFNGRAGTWINECGGTNAY